MVLCSGGTRRAHPRSRGEHHVRANNSTPIPGSSPLARGTFRRGKYPLRVHGLIPARAGNILFNTPKLNRVRAHPRSRGEHRLYQSTRTAKPGSSPLARGTYTGGEAVTRSHGLIPARAGNIQSLEWHWRFCWAHPRSRGEHRRRVLVHAFSQGSSPLAQGTFLEIDVGYAQGGLIPARAGNIAHEETQQAAARAHPRSRGEHRTRLFGEL